MHAHTANQDETEEIEESTWEYVTDWTQRNTVSLAIAVVVSVNLIGLMLL